MAATIEQKLKVLRNRAQKAWREAGMLADWAKEALEILSRPSLATMDVPTKQALRDEGLANLTAFRTVAPLIPANFSFEPTDAELAEIAGILAPPLA